VIPEEIKTNEVSPKLVPVSFLPYHNSGTKKKGPLLRTQSLEFRDDKESGMYSKFPEERAVQINLPSNVHEILLDFCLNNTGIPREYTKLRGKKHLKKTKKVGNYTQNNFQSSHRNLVYLWSIHLERNVFFKYPGYLEDTPKVQVLVVRLLFILE
jgi:hypothetical protein